MTPVTICFRPEFSLHNDALTAIIGEQGIDPNRIQEFVPVPDEIRGHPEASRELFGAEGFKVTITDPDELVDLIEAINLIEDSHRMLQTLDTEEFFDGDWIEGAKERAARIHAILDQAHEPERAKAIYEAAAMSDLDLDDDDDDLDDDLDDAFDDNPDPGR